MVVILITVEKDGFQRGDSLVEKVISRIDIAGGRVTLLTPCLSHWNMLSDDQPGATYVLI